MLRFLDGPRAVRVFRLDKTAEVKRVVLGGIAKEAWDFAPAEGVILTEEETAEIQGFSTAKREAFESEEKSTALNLPKTMDVAMRYWETKANDAEKKIIAAAIAGAARQTQRAAGGDAERPRKKKPAPTDSLPTPQALAEALFQILSTTNNETKVSGDPSEGKKTRITGVVDLNEVAAKLLSQAPG